MPHDTDLCRIQAVTALQRRAAPQGSTRMNPCDICCQKHAAALLYALTWSGREPPIKHAHAHSHINKHWCVSRHLGPRAPTPQPGLFNEDWPLCVWSCCQPTAPRPLSLMPIQQSPQPLRLLPRRLGLTMDPKQKHSWAVVRYQSHSGWNCEGRRGKKWGWKKKQLQLASSTVMAPLIVFFCFPQMFL